MSKCPPEVREIEVRDAEKVDRAILCISRKYLDIAHRLLLEVIENTPANYVNEFIEGDSLFVKFWDQQEFIHYVNWHKGSFEVENVVWIKNAYPRAFYYLGFMMMEAKEWGKAIEFLEKGQALEPTNPNFTTEKAQAFAQLGDHQKALELYKQAQTINAHSNEHKKAVALRGEGFVLTEMGDLDGAEKAYCESLKIEPKNKLAQKELKYIARLRSGRKPGRAITMSTGLARHWWQFWKW